MSSGAQIFWFKRVVRAGPAVEVLSLLHREHSCSALWTLEETGDDWTYRRGSDAYRAEAARVQARHGSRKKAG